MRLNPDCLRGILLTAEELCSDDVAWSYSKDHCDSAYLTSFSHSEIIYHIRQSEAACLLKKVSYYEDGKCAIIYDLTPKGHEFLANIREDSLWQKVLKKASSASLPILIDAAKEIAIAHFRG